jgi:hypothetical protein
MVTGINPGTGLTTGGTTVTLTGTGFTGATAVTFGGTPAASFTVDSDAQITAVAPPGVDGTVQVTVTTAGGPSNGFAYTYFSVLSLTSVVPDAGPTFPGATVVLTGTKLTGATAVTFGGTPAISFTVDSATQITAIAPAGAAGTIQVTVTTPDGTSNGVAYTYVRAPMISSLSPSSGPTTGGTVLTITGSGFTGATAVTFGVTPAASFTIDSDTQIRAVSPAHAGVVQVTITTAGGTSNGLVFAFF